MDLRAQKRRSFLSQPYGASSSSLQRVLIQQDPPESPKDHRQWPSHESLHDSSVASRNMSSNIPDTNMSPGLPSTPKQAMKSHKLVCVGDGGCGKTSLLTRWVRGTLPETYVPTVFENDVKVIPWRGGTVELALWDTAGQEEYDRLRSLAYPGTDVILVCYAIDEPVSLENVRDRWLPEVRHYCPGIPLILVGLKSDRRKAADPNRHTLIVDRKCGEQLAQDLRVNGFLECSAINNDNVDEVFGMALDFVTGHEEPTYLRDTRDGRGSVDLRSTNKTEIISPQGQIILRDDGGSREPRGSPLTAHEDLKETQEHATESNDLKKPAPISHHVSHIVTSSRTRKSRAASSRMRKSRTHCIVS